MASASLTVCCPLSASPRPGATDFGSKARILFNEVTGEHHLRVREPCNDIARRVPGTQLHELYFTLAEEERHLASKCQIGPGKPRNAFSVPEQPRETAILGLPILLSPFGNQPICFARTDD